MRHVAQRRHGRSFRGDRLDGADWIDLHRAADVAHSIAELAQLIRQRRSGWRAVNRMGIGWEATPARRQSRNFIAFNSGAAGLEPATFGVTGHTKSNEIIARKPQKTTDKPGRHSSPPSGPTLLPLCPTFAALRRRTGKAVEASYSRRMPRAHLDRTHRRALALLAGAPEGYTARVLLTHGIGLDILAELAEAGFVTMEAENVTSGERTEVMRVRLTEAGRAELPRA
jgi:hypothetical protein